MLCRWRSASSPGAPGPARRTTSVCVCFHRQGEPGPRAEPPARPPVLRARVHRAPHASNRARTAPYVVCVTHECTPSCVPQEHTVPRDRGSCAVCLCSGLGLWLSAAFLPPFSATTGSIRPVRLVDPIRGGPGATPVVLARVMLPTHTCTPHAFRRSTRYPEIVWIDEWMAAQGAPPGLMLQGRGSHQANFFSCSFRDKFILKLIHTQ